MTDHSHFVQGVAWDPLGEYIATQSSDRSVLVYNNKFKLVGRFSKLEGRMYHDENLNSFFRRLAWSPDGAILVTPSGINSQQNVSWIYVRGLLQPVAYLPGLAKPSVAVRFNPNRFTLLEGSQMFSLEYRMIFAVATQDAVVLYDTQRVKPFAFIGHVHYATLTDIAWTADGLCLVISSTDGFCTLVEFNPGELGEIAQVKVSEEVAVAAVEPTEAPIVGIDAETPQIVSIDVDAIATKSDVPLDTSAQPIVIEGVEMQVDHKETLSERVEPFCMPEVLKSASESAVRADDMPGDIQFIKSMPKPVIVEEATNLKVDAMPVIVDKAVQDEATKDKENTPLEPTQPLNPAQPLQPVQQLQQLQPMQQVQTTPSAQQPKKKRIQPTWIRD